MVDRLEELLAQMADENDEEQEDALALEAERVPPAAPAPRSEGRPEGSEDLGNPQESEQGKREAASAPMETGKLWAAIPRMVGEQTPEDDRLASAHENGLTATRALRTGGGQTAEGSWPAKPATVTEDTATAPALSASAERGLEELYRRTAQASRPAVQSLPVEQAGRTLRAEEPGRAAALTVDELDRAVRRDSRRYDGGMSIF
ncbi:MAG: hypothetical protein K2M42_05145 [Oscillospiraceae bacterium]|nr:hypothetical protein [Oscillospiraceae bacterium]